LRRVALFTEGHTEQILVRECLLRIMDPSKLSFECYTLLAHTLKSAPYRFPPSSLNNNAEVFFMIIDAHGDEGVISAIKDRERDLIENGHYDVILGLRDMYCDAYHRLAQGTIKDSVSAQLIQSHQAIINTMTYRDRIKLHYTIMEGEAWILAMYNLFKKIDPTVTTEYIKMKLGIDLKTTDPQVTFYRPSEQLQSVLSLCGRQYKKKFSDVQAICAQIDRKDIRDAVRNGRCRSFDIFRREIQL